MVYLRYNDTIVKIDSGDITGSINLVSLLSKKFPGKTFPENTIFKSSDSATVTDIGDDSYGDKNDDIITAIVPCVKQDGNLTKRLIYSQNFPLAATMHSIKNALCLTEAVQADNFIIVPRMGEDRLSRGLFIELPEEKDAEKILQKKCYVLDVGNKGKEVKMPFVSPSAEILDWYLQEKRKLKVVLIENLSSRLTTADIRIALPTVPIYSIHILDKNIAFIEFEERYLDALMRYNKKHIDSKEISLKEVDQKTMVTQITAFNHREKHSAKKSENKSAIKKPKVSRKHPRYVNKDFVCVKIENLPIGTAKLDLARFFDEGAVQPVLMHKKKDGSQFYCEFFTVKDCDVAVSMDKKTGLGKDGEISIFRVEYSEIEALKTNHDFDVDKKSFDDFGMDPDLSGNSEKSPDSTDNEENNSEE